jgi:aminoglycoside phosphotransferase (APT) family kinase protein
MLSGSLAYRRVEHDDPRGRLTAYLSELIGERLTVVELERIEGGWSRQTHRVVAERPDGSPMRLALRGEVANSLLDTDLEREWHILEGVAGSAIPLPEVYGFEGTSEVLGHRFITTGWVGGVAINPWRLRPEDWKDTAAAVAGPWLDDIVALHRLDPARLQQRGIDVGVDATTYVTAQVEHWTGLIRGAKHHPGPLVEQACSWLERHVPAPAAATAIVHGDLRIGNMLVDGDRVVAFLDWEMAGVGDWRADIGYSLMPYNAGKLLAPMEPSWNRMMPPRQFLERYFDAAGREMTDDEVAYFIVLGNIKMIAILCTGIDAYMDRSNPDPRLAWTSLAVPGLVYDSVELIEGGLRW